MTTTLPSSAASMAKTELSAAAAAARGGESGRRGTVMIMLLALLCLLSILQVWRGGLRAIVFENVFIAAAASESSVTTIQESDAVVLPLSPPLSLSLLSSTSSSSVLFNTVVLEAYQMAISGSIQTQQPPTLKRQQQQRPSFDVQTWHRKSTGGLLDPDRVMLAEYYRQAESVFEYGLGESTHIAHHVGVPRYAGIDSDADWVAKARTDVSPDFRFYFADIGPIRAWGNPQFKLAKRIFQYQLAPLFSEPQPFDVYMVDGRWRLACLLVSFLHAHARGADPQHTVVLLHDCYYVGQPNVTHMDRPQYRKADHLLDLVRHSGGRLCAYQRKNTTTDQDLVDLWHQEYATTV